jgi:hypothetical protein
MRLHLSPPPLEYGFFVEDEINLMSSKMKDTVKKYFERDYTEEYVDQMTVGIQTVVKDYFTRLDIDGDGFLIGTEIGGLNINVSEDSLVKSIQDASLEHAITMKELKIESAFIDAFPPYEPGQIINQDDFINNLRNNLGLPPPSEEKKQGMFFDPVALKAIEASGAVLSQLAPSDTGEALTEFHPGSPGPMTPDKSREI